ncbi:outer membrane lipoprotein chaperone LolA [Roseateles depolymerans]|uniref:Outer-membrane lipoprotein carrier protein n=1 Tax=Roseateles depolymerans TaxID=76731 RepID=A0A0U3LEB6_9BURK|nr:outer membrane lipoprotein chaperone LolA [Roseateles depolymerans]ALV06463.1 membrane protein [Roseateles depolymerans]REG19438.1 outer membrane lipoprotein carrier protein [Roseateles depolymerans]
MPFLRFKALQVFHGRSVTPVRARAHGTLAGLVLLAATGLARADGVASLQQFVTEVKSGRATFNQTVTAPDGKRKKATTGTFEFQRPNQFRFSYDKPAEQLIIGDGKKVWVYDPDLAQASVRNMDQALGATPVALLAGGDLSKDFILKSQPAEQGVEWALATPKRSDSGLQSLRLGFRGRELVALEIVDAFGQRSVMQFNSVQVNAKVAPERFRFDPPAGTDVMEQR